MCRDLLRGAYALLIQLGVMALCCCLGNSVRPEILAYVYDVFFLLGWKAPCTFRPAWFALGGLPDRQ